MKNLWNPKESQKAKTKLDLLVYSSRLIGQEPKLCVWGGGNTSTKVLGKDHRGQKIPILYIKGSGSDLKVSQPKDYPPVRLEDLLDAFDKEAMTDEEMVDYVSRCLLEPKAPRPSIEVLLHAFVDEQDIHHTHADAILSITNTKNNKKIAQEIYGDELLWIPYVKPGFTLAKWVGQAYRKNPKAKGLILEKHGLITWGDNAKISYDRTIEMVTRAERYLKAAEKKRKYWNTPKYQSKPSADKKQWLVDHLPEIRNVVSQGESTLAFFSDSKEVMEFINARDTVQISQLGPATPDHMLRTKRVPLYVKVPKEGIQKLTVVQLRKQIENYAVAHKKYFEKFRHLLPQDGTTKMLNPYPKVILIPQVGMITFGKDLKSAKIVAEIYEHSVSVMMNATRIDQYRSLSERLAFEMDYWPMELYKLSLAPPEALFSRQVGLVTGAARGIGKSIAEKLALDGAHVFLADINQKALDQAVADINKKAKAERAFALRMDVTDVKSVRESIEKILLTCGGLDFLVSNAGVAHVAAVDNLELNDWQRSFDVNATGHFLVAREAIRILKRQALGGSLVFVTSKNVLAPGRQFGAYSASKAAQAQLARILAIENGEFGIRVNMVNPDGVFEDSGLWDTIRDNRAKSYGISGQELESYYQNRNLMKIQILPEDVAESVAFLISNQASKMTGCILTVDGGVKEAFPR